MSIRVTMNENGKFTVYKTYPNGEENKVSNLRYAAVEVMKEQGLSINELALLMEMNPIQIDRFIKGKEMWGEIARKLCTHLNLEENDIHPGYFRVEHESAPELHRRANKSWFACSYQEWAFSQAFTNLQGMTKTKEDIRKSQNYWLSIILLLFAFIIASAFIHEFFGFGVYVVLFYAIYHGIKSSLSKAKDSLEKGTSIVRNMEDQFINYIKIDDDGILFNEMNDEQPDALTMIPWEHIGQIDFAFTQLLSKRRYLRNRLLLHSDWIPDLVDDYNTFSETELSLFLYHEPTDSPQRSLHQFQIPISWLNNGEFERLVAEIHNKSGVLIKPFDYRRSNVGIVRNDKIAHESQTKLQRIFYESRRSILQS